MPSPDERPLILVTVGTDHHPFDRLVRWVDDWLERGGEHRARALMQIGTSARPGRARWTAFLPHDELEARLNECVAVVCHGGPGTIMDARAAGLVPIVVPRRSGLGEHVDDHQVDFAARAADTEGVMLARTEEELHRFLDRAVDRPATFRDRQRPGEVTEAVRRFGRLVDQLVGVGASPSGATGSPPVRVLYIGGSGRSGSTLLDRVLGQVPGFFSAGELVHLWQRGLVEDQLCGCGERFHACELWTQVGRRAYGGWDRLDPREILELQHAVDRNRRIPHMMWSRTGGGYGAALARYTAMLSPLYEAIAGVSGSRVVIDSSKHASAAFLLRRVPGVDLRVAHLVRDPRGVAFSWSRRVRRPEVVDRTEYMPTPGTARAGIDWVAFNGLFEALGLIGVPSAFVRYESFVEDPRREVRRVLALAGHADAPIDFIGDRSVELGPAHTVSGNPMRFRVGPVQLAPDDEWRRKMDPVQRRVVSAIAFPMLVRYGYRSRSSQPEEAAG